MTPLDLARQAIADYDSGGTCWSSKELIEIIRELIHVQFDDQPSENEREPRKWT